jgi:hypothetical protein
MQAAISVVGFAQAATQNGCQVLASNHLLVSKKGELAPLFF